MAGCFNPMAGRFNPMAGCFTPYRKEVEVMVPSPKAGQVLVQVAGSALNPIDLIKLQLL